MFGCIAVVAVAIQTLLKVKFARMVPAAGRSDAGKAQTKLAGKEGIPRIGGPQARGSAEDR
jgi:hypothetical protein